MKNKRKMNTNILVQASFLVAISIVLTRLLAFMPSNTLRLSLGSVPLMLSGFLFGPVVGGIAGIAADLIGVAINPQGPPHPGFTFSSMLWGVIPALFVILANKRKNVKPYGRVLIISAVTTSILVITLGLDTYWLSQLYGKGFFVMIPTRIVSSLVNIPVQSIIILNLIKHLNKIVGE